jgi:Rrf2 family transcriptional regulator, cysteine metabolism repressor
MRLSAKAQYACVAMLELAASHPEGQLVQVKTIAETHGISQRFLVQILLQLKVHGLVRSIRGAAGGYQLARRPEAISLGDIIHAVNEPEAPSAALDSPARRNLKLSPAVQAVGAVMQELEERERQMLREVSLADILRRTEANEASMYQI